MTIISSDVLFIPFIITTLILCMSLPSYSKLSASVSLLALVGPSILACWAAMASDSWRVWILADFLCSITLPENRKEGKTQGTEKDLRGRAITKQSMCKDQPCKTHRQWRTNKESAIQHNQSSTNSFSDHALLMTHKASAITLVSYILQNSFRCLLYTLYVYGVKVCAWHDIRASP